MCGPLLEDTYKTCNVKTIKQLCEWKHCKTETLRRKKQVFEVHQTTPELPLPEPWTEEDKSELQQFLWVDMSLQETHLCVAAKQMDVATANNLDRRG